jgi:hypothetical protein
MLGGNAEDAEAMALTQAWALVKSIVAAHSVPSVALRWCSLVSWASRAAHVIGWPAAHRQFVEHGSMLAAPPGRPAIGRGGALYLVVEWRSTLGSLGWSGVSECSLAPVW